MGNAQGAEAFDPDADITEYEGTSPEQRRRILEAVNAVTFPKKKRMAMIAECLYEFDHRSQLQHDNEIREGAVCVLFQKLALAMALCYGITFTPDLLIAETESTDSDHEIAFICTALEMVHRATDQGIDEAFNEIGKEFLPMIVQVIERSYDPEEIQARLAARVTGVSKDRKIAVQKITKVLAAYSLVPSAKEIMANTPRMLTCLVKVIDVCGFNRLGPDQSGIAEMTEASRFNAVATLANLAFAEQNREVMMNEPGLVLSLSVVANSAKTQMARKCAALAISNLSGGDPSFLPAMEGNAYLLKTLVRLVKSKKNPATRRNAAVSLYNLANSEAKYAEMLSEYGPQVKLIVLVEIIGGDETLFWDAKAKRTAAEQLFNMSVSDDPETMKLLMDTPALLDGLVYVLSSTGNLTSVEVQMYAAATLRRMAEIIYHPHPSHPMLLRALMKVISWTKTPDVAQAFDMQASFPGHAQILVNFEGMLDTMSELTMVEGDGAPICRAYALSAIERLSMVPEVRPIMVKNETVMMALTRVSYIGRDENERLDEASRARVKTTLKYLVAAM